MIKHKIYVRHYNVAPEHRLPILLIRRSIRAALTAQDVDVPCEISVFITDDSGISQINGEYRSLSAPTDVLSFPMLDFSKPGWAYRGPEPALTQSGHLLLGDIVISAERVAKQAREYGHSSEAEAAYLIVHSVLHLLGYDHIDEAEGKREMREREKLIMRDFYPDGR